MSGEMDGELPFRVLKPATSDGALARLGRLELPGRKSLDTPNFFGVTSRGAIPHLTPDTILKYTQTNGVYMALEDFLEKSGKRATPALFTSPTDADGRRLHSYTATPSDVTIVLGPRRHPAVVSPGGNGATYVSICTSTGFQSLDMERYCNSVATVKPDVVIPLADLTFGPGISSAKRQRRMVERTEEWVEAFFKTLDPQEVLKPAGIHAFAPLLPVEYPMQWEYLNRLSEDHAHHLSGLAVYDANILADLQQHKPLVDLPRLSMDPPASPHHILRQVRMGVDVLTIPFLNSISDQGIALTFSFPPSQTEDGRILPLGLNMWLKEHQVSLSPLEEGCSCYACTKHHRAFLQHLLNAKEMLGWNLLQIHNLHVMTQFFEAIRVAIADGSFEEKARDFARAYDPELPLGTGEPPRSRGYHFKSIANQPKINEPPWQALEGDKGEDQVLAGEIAGLVVTGHSAVGGETPLVPDADADAADLDQSGFAEVEKRA
ncbi:hypothetical protein JX266_005542 [Neoarthrinium moseri]|nr:hypothetical protein JX266_005542 [Neoarthrinium moseri]